MVLDRLELCVVCVLEKPYSAAESRLRASLKLPADWDRDWGVARFPAVSVTVIVFSLANCPVAAFTCWIMLDVLENWGSTSELLWNPWIILFDLIYFYLSGFTVLIGRERDAACCSSKVPI